MTNVREATTSLVEERPDLEGALRELLAVDEANDTWEFDDTSLDSGTFGEIVGAEIVVKRNGQYQLNDATSARAALNGEHHVHHLEHKSAL